MRCDSIFRTEFLNRLSQTDTSRELCSLIGASEIPYRYQRVTERLVGGASVICATHGQKRFAVTRFAMLLYCLCTGLG
jgi:hypothetical protein